MFHRFPYTNFHDINLDWILAIIKKAVFSINGVEPDENGEVTISGAELGVVGSVNHVSPVDGNVQLSPSDIGALPDTYDPPVTSVNGETGAVRLNASDVHAVAYVNDIPPDADGNVDVGTVKSVNNTLPDSSGNVNLPTVAGVTSVNGVGADAQGNVQIDAEDVGALPDTYTAPVTSVNGQTGAVVIPGAPVASVNGQTGAVVLDADDVGALPDSYTAPVASVNGETGTVVLDADDVGALNKPTLIWSNPNPNQSFGVQSITVPDMSSYSFILFGFDSMSSTRYMLVSGITNYAIGSGCYVTETIQNQYRRRIATIDSATSISFTNDNGDNTTLIPKLIYGIK